MELFFGITGALLAAIFLTSFIKILTALNILRYGIGLSDGPFGVVIIGVSCALTLVIMQPRVEANGGVDGLSRAGGASIEQGYRPFLESHADKKVIGRLMGIRAKLQKPAAAPSSGEGAATPFPILVSAFMISELSSAFTIGLLFLIPFVVIDLAVANLLMALGVTQISQQVISLPLKLLLFVAVDGWGMVAEKLLGSYL